MKKVIFAAFAFISVLIFSSCSNDEDTSVTDYDISEIYGWTYYGNITASSGNTLIPSIVIYNDERCDWNMSVNGMNNNQFYYYSVKNSEANYTLYWYSAENVSYCKSKDSSKASMVVQLGINSLDEVVILLTGDNLTGVSGMTNTRVPMTRQTNIGKNTTPSEIEYDEEVEDISIEIPSAAQASSWGGDSSYTGSFVYMVGDGGSLAKGSGTSGTDESGNEITPTVKITDTSSTAANTVTVTVPRFAYTEAMTIEPYDIEGVQVSKDGETYYLSYEAASESTVTAEKADGTTININSLTLKGKLENGTLTLRTSFYPGKMPFPIIQIFTSTN
ncbi:calycin-like domain-containing protein [Treponema sp.]|uniref:calycin-like domain-containing protein n=1 Tax=Treponema sp. TaxID=166 RepID=UPI00388EF374